MTYSKYNIDKNTGKYSSWMFPFLEIIMFQSEPDHVEEYLVK